MNKDDIGKIIVENHKRSVTVNGISIKLSKLQYDLLYYMIKNKHLALYREKMIEDVWDIYVTDRSVDVAVNKLRKIFDGAGHGICRLDKYEDGVISIIETIPGGYKFVGNAEIRDKLQNYSDISDENGIHLYKPYVDSSHNMVIPVAIADSKHGKLVISVSGKYYNANPIKDFNLIFSLYKIE